MLVSLNEAKAWLRVDTSDDDALITQLEASAEELVRSVMRLESTDDLESYPVAKVGVLYALAYWYEHREAADNHELTISLRNMLQGFRAAAF